MTRGRPRINPAAPMTPAERQRRRRARVGKATLNRIRRRKAKVKRAATRKAAVAAKAAARLEKLASERAQAAATIAALSETIRQLTNGGGQRHRNMNGLTGYTVETIAEADALALILQHEWLGTLGNARIFMGLYSPQRELQGVACFGHGPNGDIRRRIGSPALCLARGACTPSAPKNAASFLINAACKYVYRAEGTAIFFAYADPNAGEYGAVYQAAGWAYLGQGLHGNATRTRRYAVLEPGADPDNPAKWQMTHALRRNGRHLSFAEARAAGWQIATREAKHVYATHVGRDRKQWRRSVVTLPYPTPRPELKLSGADADRTRMRTAIY